MIALGSLALHCVLAVLPAQPALPANLQAEVERLVGQSLELGADSYTILDIAGEGAPRIGCIEKEAESLYLVDGDQRVRLSGPLAIPRIAGPNYKVWIIGDAKANAELFVRRIGILAGPSSAGCTSASARTTASSP